MEPYPIFFDEGGEVYDPRFASGKRSVRNKHERCPPGYHLVFDHFRNRKGNQSMALEIEGEGVYVKDHCAKNPRRNKDGMS